MFFFNLQIRNVFNIYGTNINDCIIVSEESLTFLYRIASSIRFS